MTVSPTFSREPVPARPLWVVRGPEPMPAPMPACAAPAWAERLSPREAEVLRHVARGMSNAEIAAELFISLATVKSHVARLLSKLKVRDRVQLVVAAYRSGFVPVHGPAVPVWAGDRHHLG